MSATNPHDAEPEVIGEWLSAMLEPPPQLPPFTHTFAPAEPPRRRWWQFWRRGPSVWPTYTLDREEEEPAGMSPVAFARLPAWRRRLHKRG